MTIVEGQIETLRKLKESLSRNGITRFNSIGEIRRFLRDFETEKEQLPSRIERDVEAEIQNMQSTLASHQRTYDEQTREIRSEIEQQIHKLKADIERVSNRSKRTILFRVLYSLRVSSLSRKASRLEKNREKIIAKRASGIEKTIARYIDG